jgi:hypothetical protein
LSHTAAAARFPMEIVTGEVGSLSAGLRTCTRAIQSIEAELSGAIGDLATRAAGSSDVENAAGGVDLESEEVDEETGFSQFLIIVSSAHTVCLCVCP